MDIALLHNPAAGDEDHTQEKLLRLLKQHGHKVRYAAVNDGLADKKLIKWADMVAAAGGDGTLRRTLTRMAGEPIPVGILPLGTANNIARSLGIGADIAALVASWDKGKPRKIDLGVAKGPWGRTLFVEGVGIGLVGRAIAILDEFDAAVIHEFPSAAEKLHRDISVVTALAYEMPPVRARLRIEGDRIKDEFLLLEILNIGRAGPGLLIADEARPDDGELNVVSVAGDERKKLISELQKHVAARNGGARLRDRTAKKIRLDVAPCELRIDDRICLEPADFLKLPEQRARIDIRVEPAAVAVFC